MVLGPEDRLHLWLRRRLQRSGVDRLGDDAAILPAGGPWAVTQDQQIEGVHFTTDLDPRRLARRLLAVNLSDLAAMGARPRFAFLALSCPAEYAARRFLDSFVAACERFAVELAGGDLSRNDRVHATLTLIGDQPSGSRWLTRGGGEPGDRVWLAGVLGLSALGRALLDRGAAFDTRRIDLSGIGNLTRKETVLGRSAVRAHLLPHPQLEVGRWLSRQRRAAAIDVSDGLAIDLRRLCRESEVGATIKVESLPVPAELDSLCQRLEISRRSLVWGGGEDYALLFSLPHEVTPPTGLGCTPVGELTEGHAVRVWDGGALRPLPEAGWDHFLIRGQE